MDNIQHRAENPKRAAPADLFRASLAYRYESNEHKKNKDAIAFMR
jgi:hypothetical protein